MSHTLSKKTNKKTTAVHKKKLGASSKKPHRNKNIFRQGSPRLNLNGEATPFENLINRHWVTITEIHNFSCTFFSSNWTEKGIYRVKNIEKYRSEKSFYLNSFHAIRTLSSLLLDPNIFQFLIANIEEHWSSKTSSLRRTSPNSGKGHLQKLRTFTTPQAKILKSTKCVIPQKYKTIWRRKVTAGFIQRKNNVHSKSKTATSSTNIKILPRLNHDYNTIIHHTLGNVLCRLT